MRLALSLVLAGLAACGGRIALYQNVPDGGAGGGGTSAGGGTGGAATEPPFQPLDINAEWRGAGCGRALPAEQITTTPGSPKGYTHFTVMATGVNLTDTSNPAGPRTFWVRVPAGYDPNRAYRVVFLREGCGGYQTANTATLPLYKAEEQAIYVAMDVPDNGVSFSCSEDPTGLRSQEWEAFQLFMSFVDQRYCVDLNKIYVAGTFLGADLANMWGCYFAGWPSPARKIAPRYHIRAQAGKTGGEPVEQPTCGGLVAALWLHDRNDFGRSIDQDIAALERVGRMNGCDTTYDDASIQEPWHPEVAAIGDGICKRFTRCSRNYPVVFCTTEGLGKSDQEDRMVAALKLFFDEVEAGEPGTVPIP
jgi:hypothetical protein